MLDRPSDVVFSSDGRVFIADDASGHVYWMAPTSQPAPTN
jgi:glucose/arabinose dehydrogenase